MTIFFTILISIMIFIFFMKKMKTTTLMIFLCLLIFPLVYDFLFNILIMWPNNEWYFIVLSLFFILFTSFSLKDIQKYLIFNKTFFYVFLSLLSVIFSWNVFLQSFAIKNKTQFVFPYRDNSVEQLYDYLRDRGDPDDIVIQFSLVPILGSKLTEIIFKKKLYYKPKEHPEMNAYRVVYSKKPPFFRESDNDIIYYLDWKKISLKKNKKIFFISISDKEMIEENEDKAYGVLKKTIGGIKIGRFMVSEFVLKNKKREKQYLEFLSFLNKKTPKKQRGSIYETLLYYAYKNKKRESFNQLLKEYKDIGMVLDEKMPRFNMPSQFEHSRRVKYFENLQWSK